MACAYYAGGKGGTGADTNGSGRRDLADGIAARVEASDAARAKGGDARRGKNGEVSADGDGKSSRSAAVMSNEFYQHRMEELMTMEPGV